MVSKWLRAICDWNQLYWQMLLCVITLILLSYCFFSDFLTCLLNILQPYVGQLSDNILIIFLIASKLECKMFISAVFFIMCLYYVIKKIRNTNKTYILNDNSEFRRLHIHSYLEYWLAYHILGVRKCQLTRVPIPMQFKLILQGPFSNYLYQEGVREAVSDSKSCVLIDRMGKIDAEDSEINLVLNDTYPINLEKQLPKALERKTLFISRFQGNFTRIHSRNFVESVLNEVRRLPQTVTTLHIYATLNSWNTYEITKEVFKTGGRDSIKCLYVYYQSEKNPRLFTHAERINLK